MNITMDRKAAEGTPTTDSERMWRDHGAFWDGLVRRPEPDFDSTVIDEFCNRYRKACFGCKVQVATEIYRQVTRLGKQFLMWPDSPYLGKYLGTQYLPACTCPNDLS